MPDDVWRRFRARLREIGLSEDYVAQLTKVGETPIDALGAPLRNWHARRVREPAACAARLLMLDDPVSEDDARLALGRPLVEALT